jgi:lactoylglutathione lyase
VVDDSDAGPELNLVVLRVGRLDRTRAFYEALGLRFVDEQHGEGPRHLATTLPSGVVLELYPRQAIGGRWLVDEVRLGFVVADVGQAIDDLTAAGGQPVSSPMATARGRRAVVEDPDFRRVELLEVTGVLPA